MSAHGVGEGLVDVTGRIDTAKRRCKSDLSKATSDSGAGQAGTGDATDIDKGRWRERDW